jgi:membrane protein DedA with SNARE-associated domain
MLEQLSSEVSPLILALLLKYKYAVLFPILVIEGPIITILAGALAAPERNVFAIVPLFFFVIFADLCGDTFYYLIGRFAGEKIVSKISKQKHVDYHAKIKRYFDKYGGRTLMIAKISHGLGWPVMAFAGSVPMPYGRFFSFCFITSVIKTAVLLGAGYYYSDNYKELVSYFGSFGTLVTTTVVVIAAIYLLKQFRVKA